MTRIPIDIRQAVVADAKAIAEVHVASWQSAYAGIVPASYLEALSVEPRERSWHKVLEAGRTQVALAYVGDSLAGWVAYGKCRDADRDASWGEIEAIYLHPAQYGVGIGASLMQHASQSLVLMGFSAASLWVLAENTRARKFYERAGFFTNEAAKEFELGGAVLREVRYQRALTA